MRLHGAIFSIEDTLSRHEDADKVLSILKMEGVWMYAVTAMERGEAERMLRELGLSDYFRGILTAREANCAASDAKLFEKAARRLRLTMRDAVVFAGRLDALQNARAAGFRVAAVRGAAPDGEWALMCAEADEVVDRFADFLS